MTTGHGQRKGLVGLFYGKKHKHMAIRHTIKALKCHQKIGRRRHFKATTWFRKYLLVQPIYRSGNDVYNFNMKVTEHKMPTAM